FPSIVGTNDRGNIGGNHYLEVYLQSTDSMENCYPYSGADGYMVVWYSGNDSNVTESYSGVSGYDTHVCQVNVYAVNGSGQKTMRFDFEENGHQTSQGPQYTFTF